MAEFETVDIPEIGNVKIPSRGFASEQTLLDLKNAMEGRGSGKAKAASDAADKATKATAGFGKNLVKVNPALTALEFGFNALATTIRATGGLLSALSSMTGRFEDLGAVVDFTRDITKGFFENLPLGIGNAIGASADLAAEITKLKLTLMDMNADAFESLALTGVRASTNIDELVETVLRANISVDQFNRLAIQSADGLRVFGGTASGAAEKFSSRLERLTDQSSETGINLRLLGLNSESIAEEFADFISSNKNNRMLMTMSEQELNKVMLERAKNERTLAEFTGRSVQEQKQAFAEAANDAAFQADLLGTTYQSAMTKFGSIEGPVGDAIKQLSTFGTVTNESTARIIATIPGMDEQIRASNARIKSAKTAEEAERIAVEEEMKIRALGTKLLETQNGKFLAQIGMLDTGFQDFGEFALTSSRMITQLENLNKDLGTDFTDPMEAEQYIRSLRDSVQDTIHTLKGEGRLTAASLSAATDLDEKTAALIIARMKQEDVVGEFQAGMNDLIDGTDALIGVVDTLSTGLKKALEVLFGDEEEMERLRIHAKQVAIYQSDAEVYSAGAPGSIMGAAFMKEALASDGMKSLIREVSPEIAEDRMQGGQSISVEDAKTYNKNFEVFDREYNEDGSLKKVAPMEDVSTEIKETNVLIREMIRQQKNQITATEDLGGSYTG